MLVIDVLSYIALRAGIFGPVGLTSVLGMLGNDVSRAAGWALGLIVMGEAADRALGLKTLNGIESEAEGLQISTK
jgi:hypothetical protein